MAHTLRIRPEEERRSRHIAAAREWHLRPVLREALNLGLLLMLAGTPTDEHGRYGGLLPKELATRLQPLSLQILELLHQEGCLPALLTYLPPAAGGASPYHAAVPLPSMDGVRPHGVHGTHPPHDGDADLLAELLDAGCMLVED